MQAPDGCGQVNLDRDAAGGRPRRILCDWGSTRLRAYLDVGDTVVDRREGPGIGVLAGVSPLEALRSALEPWTESGGIDQIVLCGMAGSRNGVVEVPYVAAPVDLHGWATHSAAQRCGSLDITVATGVSGLNFSGAPDVMRGEETQIFGALALHPEFTRGFHRMLLPGTHSKWVEISDGSLVRWQTCITGELYALLRDQSSLLRAGRAEEDSSGGFEAGVRAAAMRGLAETLFEVRSAQLILGRTFGWAAAFLSGLLIGNEVRSMLQSWPSATAVTTVGDVKLSSLYRRVLATHGVYGAELDAERCSIAGLRLLTDHRP